jgi:hypothetical protein
LSAIGDPHAVTAPAITRKLRDAAAQPDAVVLLVAVYGRERIARAVVVRAARPARYLLGMARLLTAMGGVAYVRVVDAHGRRVFEWYTTGSGGMLYVRHDLEGCSQAKALGWSKIPPCPLR